MNNRLQTHFTNIRLDNAILEHFMKLAHKDQTRDDGQTPYWIHPLRVVKILEDTFLNTGADAPAYWDLIYKAALFHDVLEDTHVSITDLATLGLDKQILSTIIELSTDVFPKSYPGTLKDPYILQHLKEISSEAILIKLADRLDNLTDCKHWTIVRRKRYAKRTEAMLEVLRTINPLAYFNQIEYLKSQIEQKISEINALS